jgi:amino acid transporter
MNIDDQNGTTVLHRPSEETPPRTLSSLLIGKPLATADAPHETIGKVVGLAVFASDALSSTAYSAQEMLVILVMLGGAAYSYLFPMTLIIVGLLAILTISYEQTIHAYPNGGGAYIVSRDNLGEFPAMVAAAALLTDYILTVAVSVASGVAQIVSAFPALFDYRVWICVGMILFIMIINLRGVRESGIIFAIPTYFFVVMMVITLCVGIYRAVTGSMGVLTDPPKVEMLHGYQSISLLLLLRAFSNGTTALTGVEAISNGIPAFRTPKSKNAGITLIWMSVILGVLLLGVAYLIAHIQAVPSEIETPISQIGRSVFAGRNIFYYLMISATMVILIMAANTSFADFPRLGALTAADGFLPRQLSSRGSRLVFSRGIITLALVASLLIIVFQASVTKLIPLYAIGVFLSFTLSQAGMAHRWWKIGHLKEGEEVKERGSTLRAEKNWQFKMVINGIGSVISFLVMAIFAFTKFADGAWVVVIIIPVLVYIFNTIHTHYRGLAGKLTLDRYGSPMPRITRNRVVLPIGGVHRGTLAALRYARTLSDDVTAVHVSIDPDETNKLRAKWEIWGDGVRLVIVDSSYRRFMEPLVAYIEDIYTKRQPHEVITIVVPQFVSHNKFTNFLHTNTAAALRQSLTYYKGVVVTNVPYIVD